MPRKKVVAPAQSLNFQDRLQWKMNHLTMPTTSTPKCDPKAKPRKVTKRDIETAFGFDDSCNIEGNYSTLVSPISNANNTQIRKANPLSQLVCNTTERLHVDPSKIVKTYGTMKRVKTSEDQKVDVDYFKKLYSAFTTEDDKVDSHKCQPKPSKKPRAKKARKLGPSEEVDEETRKWMEEKNKEFEDVLKVPLVIENPSGPKIRI